MSYYTKADFEAESKLICEQEVAQEKEDARLLKLALASCKKRVSKVWYD